VVVIYSFFLRPKIHLLQKLKRGLGNFLPDVLYVPDLRTQFAGPLPDVCRTAYWNGFEVKD